MIRDQLVGNTEENICSGNTFGSSRKGGGRGGREGRILASGPSARCQRVKRRESESRKSDEREREREQSRKEVAEGDLAGFSSDR